jgi:hypothetical protein
MLKRLMIGLAIAGLSAAPALAQKYVPEAGSGNIVKGPGGGPVTADTPPYVGQRSGEAYNYNRRSTTGQNIRHQKKKPKQIDQQKE